MMSDVTRILSAIALGDPHASEQLLPLVYEELRRLAAQRLARERSGDTLQATALVHEAYLRLVTSSPPGSEREGPAGKGIHWDSRGHFFAAAAQAMRRILVDRARDKARHKRGGGWTRVDIDALDLASKVTPDQLLAIDEALAKLARDDPPAAQLVQLRYFAGLGVEEAGQALGISTATAYRHWNYARAWLYSELQGDVLRPEPGT